jgi:hypothetical protein
LQKRRCYHYHYHHCHYHLKPRLIRLEQRIRAAAAEQALQRAWAMALQEMPAASRMTCGWTIQCWLGLWG